MLSVFYAILPDAKIEKTGNIERNTEICSTLNEKVKKQKYFVWQLLLKGLETLNYNLQEIKFFKSENGRWSSNAVDFSLSHSENIVAVAISNMPVGVDVEKFKELNLKLANKILTESEMQEFLNLEKNEQNVYLIKKWTQKESIFKKSKQTVCRYKQLTENSENLTTTKLELENETYFISVCHQSKSSPKFLKLEL